MKPWLFLLGGLISKSASLSLGMGVLCISDFCCMAFVLRYNTPIKPCLFKLAQRPELSSKSAFRTALIVSHVSYLPNALFQLQAVRCLKFHYLEIRTPIYTQGRLVAPLHAVAPFSDVNVSAPASPQGTYMTLSLLYHLSPFYYLQQ